MKARERRLIRRSSLLRTLVFCFFIPLLASSVVLLGTALPTFARTRVQKGATSFTDSSDDHYIDVNKVDLDKTVLIISYKTHLNSKVQDPASHCWGARFQDSDTIQLHRHSTGSLNKQIVWFVIECDAWQVEYIETAIANSQLTKTVNLTNQTAGSSSAVDFEPDKTFAVSTATDNASSLATVNNAYR